MCSLCRPQKSSKLHVIQANVWPSSEPAQGELAYHFLGTQASVLWWIQQEGALRMYNSLHSWGWAELVISLYDVCYVTRLYQRQFGIKRMLGQDPKKFTQWALHQASGIFEHLPFKQYQALLVHMSTKAIFFNHPFTSKGVCPKDKGGCGLRIYMSRASLSS